MMHVLSPAQGAFGPDRIVHFLYDNEGRVIAEQRAYGVAGQQQNYFSATFGDDGERLSFTDANGNRTDMAYDGFDRCVGPSFRIPDSRRRSGLLVVRRPWAEILKSISMMAQATLRYVPCEGERRSATAMTLSIAKRSGICQARLPKTSTRRTICLAKLFRRDLDRPEDRGSNRHMTLLAGRITEGSFGRTMTSAFDAAEIAFCLTWPDGFSAQYTYDAMNQLDLVKEVASGTVLTNFDYDARGRRQSISRTDGAVSSFAYDSISRLSQFSADLPSTANDQTVTLGYSPSSQISQRVASNDNYAWHPSTLNLSYESNALNQYSTVGANTYLYDSRGNLVSDGPRAFTYDLENHLRSVTGSVTGTLGYDPTGRLQQVALVASPQHFYMTAISSLPSTTARVHCVVGTCMEPTTDEPLVWYECAVPPSAMRN